ncbi:MAG: HEAT repeat domain-containing protein [Deltaproteobacteria bacterium]|nr:HEAT repeat domain-containing protein [Deltaproteobacteria bacterium]
MDVFDELWRCKGYGTGARAGGKFALPGARPQYPPDRTFDTEHIRLEVVLDLPRKALTGVCTTTLKALVDGAQAMTFDAVAFRLDHVSRDGGRPVRHRYDGRKLTVELARPLRAGERVKVAIAYRVRQPKLGLYFIGPDRQHPTRPTQVWTQGETEYARYWFPCHDAPQERMTSELIATVPEEFLVVSNGALVRTTHHARRLARTYHWRQTVPHSPYLVTLAAGRFSVIRDRWRRVPLLYYCQPGQEADARRALGKTPEMMAFFSRFIGIPYPYAKYAQVAAVDFIYGGMENTSATTLTARTLHDERAHLDFSSDPLVAHELAHQWFGDLLTCKDWSHAWLNESFATYFEALFKEQDLGKDEFAYEMSGNAQAYFDEDKERYRRPIVTRTYKAPDDLFDRHLYEKGSVVLHMLRYLLGDAEFRKAIRTYVRGHRGQVVETADLIEAIRLATGRNLQQFFDQWVFSPGHPEYRVRYWWEPRRRRAAVRVVQTQATDKETGLFAMPVEFAFHTPRGVRRFREVVEKKDHLFTFPLPTEPDLVLFDPDHWLLAKVDFVKPEAMWLRQLSQDPHPVGRLEAAQALGKLASPTATAALCRALPRESFWAVQGAIARALGASRSRQALEGLLEGLRRVTHPKARRVIFEALGEFREPQVLATLKERYRDEASYFAEAEAIKGIGRMRDASVLATLAPLLRRESWNDVLRAGAVEAIAASKAPEALPILKRHSAYGYQLSTRLAAIRGLAELGAGRGDVQAHLVRLTRDPDLLVRLAAVRALGQLGDERAVPALKRLTEGDLDGRLKRQAEEAIAKIREGMEEEKGKG